jgi:Zn-dependent protease
MRSYDVGRISGIPIRINITLVVFLPILAWLLSRPQQIAFYAGVIEGIVPHAIDAEALLAGNTPVLIGVLTAIGLFVGVLIHELGHSYAAMRYDIGISSITLWIFGGMAHMERLPEDWDVEFWIALAGPVTSVALGALFYAVVIVVPPVSSVLVFVLGWLAVINVVLAVFNMVPAFPMDGGRILRALLARSRPYVEATQTAAAVGKFFAVLMAVVGILALAPLMILVAMFVYIAAGAESRTTVLRDLLRGVTVEDLMTTDVSTVRPETTLRELFERMRAERHTGYPVVTDGGELVGTVTLERIRGTSRERLESITVADVMLTDPPTVDPGSDAFDVMQVLGTSASDRVVVTDAGRVVGLVSQSDLVTVLEVLQGIGPLDRTELTPDGYA